MTDNTEPVFRYEPDYAVPPGETLAEVLEDRGMSQAELARRTGMSAKHINSILKGSASITPDTALKLERVLNIPARIWNALEANYQGHLSRLGEAEISNNTSGGLARTSSGTSRAEAASGESVTASSRLGRYSSSSGWPR